MASSFAAENFPGSSPVLSGTTAEMSANGYSAHVINPDLNVVQVSLADSSMLVAGSDGTIWKSRDAGMQWTDVSPSSASGIDAMLPSADGRRLVAVGNDGVIAVSSDSGGAWSQRDSGVMSNLFALSFGGPSGEDVLAVGQQGAMTWSSDGGEHWSAADSGTSVALASVLYLESDGVWLIGGEKGFMARSTGMHGTWSVTSGTCQGAISRFVAVKHAVYAACGDGKILRSIDAGKSWRTVFSGTADEYITNIAYSPLSRAMVATTSKGGVLHANSTSRWRYARISGQYLSEIAFVPARTGETIIVAGDKGTLARSVDGGKHWSRVKLPSQRRILDLGYDKAASLLVASGNGGLVLSSADQGQHWSVRNMAPDGYVHAIGRDPRSGVLLAIGSNRMVARSTDDGNHWKVTQLDQLVEPANLATLEYLPKNGAFVVAGGQRTLMESVNAGASWTSFSVMGDSYKGVIVDPDTERVLAYGDQGALGRMNSPQATPEQLPSFTDRTLFGGMTDGQGNLWVFGEEGLVARSSDFGQHWQPAPSVTSAKLFAGLVDRAGKILLVVGNGGSILRSADSGENWQLVTTPNKAPLRWIVGADNGSVLLVTGGNGTILRSTDFGESWELVPSGTLETLRGPILDPAGGDMFIVGRGGVILQSSDKGLSWQRIDAHSTSRFMRLMVDQGGRLWAHGDRLVRLDPVR